MRSDLTLYLVTGIFLILLVVLTHWCWSRSKMALTTPKPTRRKREPKPFAGYTRKPECELCAHGTDSYPQAPGAAPPRIIFTRGRRRQVDTTGHFCPHPDCSYHGWVDWGNVRANGHPNGRRWRQLVCLGCHGYFLETVGTPFHGRVDPGQAGLENQHEFHRTPESGLSPACRRYWSAGQYVVQTRSRVAPVADTVPELPQFRAAPRELALASARSDGHDGIR